MTERTQQYEVFFFQTDQYGSKVISVNGEVLVGNHPATNEGGAAKFMKDLGLKRYYLISQEQVGNGEHPRINWAFERLL